MLQNSRGFVNMTTPPKQGKLLYHITDIENLDSILRNGLAPRNKVDSFSDVADPEIISHRKRLGMLEYVPFHFFAPTPFAGAVQIDHPEKTFIYICIQRSYAKQNRFKIISKHPLSQELHDATDFHLDDYEEGIRKIDWDLMEKRDYSNEQCKCTCLAECLTDNVVFHNDFWCMYVKNEECQSKVIEVYYNMKGNGHPPFHVDVADWAFKKNV
jgi:hypothetical protein